MKKCDVFSPNALSTAVEVGASVVVYSVFDASHNCVNVFYVSIILINIGKTKHMFITHKVEHQEKLGGRNILINDENLHNVKTHKYLGVDTDCTLSFDSCNE